MKKIIAGIAMLTASSAVFAVSPGGPDCGWGNMLMEGQSGLGPQVLASTTNGTSGNATFGMTSGTNGCSANGTLTYGGKSLIGSIMGEFSEDVARGDGDALNAVAVAYGIQQPDRATFAKVLHENFSKIFPNDKVTAEDVSASIDNLIKTDARLAKYAA
jgi:hypothetical protein